MKRTAIVIGAGVIGVASAYALARRGWSVTLLDREAGPAMGTSHANGAQLSYCYTDALGSPATMAALPRIMGGKGGVSFGIGFAPDYLMWLARFARNCTAVRFRRNTLDILELALQSRDGMDALCDQHQIEFSHRVAGKIHLLYSQAEIDRARMVRDLKRTKGVEQDILPREELRQLDPALGNLDPTAIAAISTPAEVVGDPLLFCRAMKGILSREYGVGMRFNAEVADVTDHGAQAVVTLATGEELRADVAVMATGTWSNRLLAPLGHKQAIQPMKGYSFEMPLVDGSPRISVTDGKRRIVFTHLGDRMRVAGIAELGNATTTIDPLRMEWMVDAAQDCMPVGGDYQRAGHFWTGIRPATPDTKPIIKRASNSIAINTGHGALGWTLAMGSGERLAKLLDA
ncbi:hypothetical protein EH30_00755 [Erythrobacter sp. JL475]|nr:hypothetical protein EH30_00755 [Erythrobacter sp. JL475]